MAVEGFTASDYLERSSPVWPGGEPFLVHGWVQQPTDPTKTQGEVFFRLGLDADHERRYWVNPSDQSIAVDSRQVDAEGNTLHGAANPTTAFTVGVWVPTAGAWVSSTLREAWVEGGNKGTDTADVTPNAPSLTRIGNYTDGAPRPLESAWTGEVTVWDVAGLASADRDALQAELSTLVDGEAPNPLAVDRQSAQPWYRGLVAYWRLEDPTDLADLTGNGHDMTEVGSLSTAPEHPPVAAAPQFARPASDVENLGGWQDEQGGGTVIHESIDERNPDDADYVTTV